MIIVMHHVSHPARFFFFFFFWNMNLLRFIDPLQIYSLSVHTKFQTPIFYAWIF